MSRQYVYVLVHVPEDIYDGLDSFGIYGVFSTKPFAEEVRSSLNADVHIMKCKLNDLNPKFLTPGNDLTNSGFPIAAHNRMSARHTAALQGLSGVPTNVQMRLLGYE
jgi:hypothetical protein